METLELKKELGYYERPKLNHSRLKKLEQSYFKYEELDNSISEALILGSCFHEAILEPEIYATRKEASFKTVTAQGFIKEYEEQGLIIPQGKAELIEQAKDTIINHPAIPEYLEGEYETEIYAKMYGRDCKAKLDILNIEKSYINDLKTTNSISGIRNYEWWVKDALYHTQMAFYRAMVKTKYDVEVDCYLTVYGWKENDAIILKLSSEILEEAECKLQKWIDKLNAVEVFGAYKGISDEVILV